MKLGGWTRLGIVLSVAWAIGAGGYHRKVDIDSASRLALDGYRICTDARKPQRECLDDMNQTTAIFSKPVWDEVAAVALLPIPLAWLAVWGTVGVVRWVRAGFSSAA